MANIISFSGGKDSTATAILAHEQGFEDVVIVYAHFYFDKSRNISATLPEHENFIQNVIFPKFIEWGFDVIQVEPDLDYVTIAHTVKKKGKHKGDFYKFPCFIKSKCIVNSRCKMSAIKKAQCLYPNEPHFIGIAYDEPERAERLLNDNKRSLLFEQYITEAEALQICKKYGLLSPIYEYQQRDGCWFCPQQSIASSQYIDETYPELVAELEKIETLKGSNNFCRKSQGGTVRAFYSRRYKRKKMEDVQQMTIEDFLEEEK